MSEEVAPIKVAIAGAGAMGTLFGTTLIEGGNDVTFLDGWPQLLEEMKKTPVAHRILEDGKEKDYDVKVFKFEEAPEEEKDLIIITVKSSDTDATLKKLVDRKLIGKKTVVLTLQGGFDNADVIAKYHHDKNLILFGKTSCSSSGCPPRMMTIQKFKIANTTIWPLGCGKDDKPCERVEEIVKAVNASGLPFELTNLAIPDRWKMLLYYPANIAVSAVVNLDFSTCWNCEPLQKVLEKLGEECAQIAELEGVDTKYFNKEISIEAVKKLALVECPKHQGSMNQDIFNKRKTEIEATAGVLLKLAEKHKVDLPYTHTIYALIRAKESNYGNECQKPAAK